MALYTKVKDFLSRRMLFADDLAPPTICSLGCHIADHLQRVNDLELLCVMNIREPINLHIAYISPSGLSKSYILKQFFDRKYGVCPWNTKVTGKITEAGFTGQLDKNGQPNHQGLAERIADGMVGFHEIDILFKTTQAEHSSELLDQVMQAITEQHVNKTLGGGEIDFDTGVSMYGCIQPARFDFSAGLGRRFLFETRNWSIQDLEMLKDIRTQKRVREIGMYDEQTTIRNELATRKKEFYIEDIEMDSTLLSYIKRISGNQSEMSLYERVAIGYHVLETWNSNTHTLKVEPTKELYHVLGLLTNMHEMVVKGGDVSLLTSMMTTQQKWTSTELWDLFKNFGYTYEKFMELMEYCMRLNLVNMRMEIMADGTRRRIYMLEGR